MVPLFLCLPQIDNSPNVLIENDRFCHSSHKSLQRFPISLKKWKKKKKERKKENKTKLLSSKDFPVLHMLSSCLSDTIFYSPCSLCLTPTVPLPCKSSIPLLIPLQAFECWFLCPDWSYVVPTSLVFSFYLGLSLSPQISKEDPL